MTTAFKWDDYEDVGSGFDWDSYETVKPERGAVEKTARVGAQVGLSAIDTALLPLTAAGFVAGQQTGNKGKYRETLSKEIQDLEEKRKTEPLTNREERALKAAKDTIVHLGEPKEGENEKIDLTPSGLIKRGVKAATGYDLEAEGAAEHVAEFVGALGPKQLIKGAQKLKNLPKLATSEGRQALKSQSQWKALEKSAKGSAEKTEILDFAKQKNLTAEETSLLFQSQGKIKKLEKISKKGKKFKGIVTGLKDKLGASYEELKNLGRQGGYLTEQEASRLQTDMEGILEDIGRTFVEGPDTKAAKEIIEKTIHNLENKAGTIEDLINSRRNLNQFKNWKNLNEGDAIRSRAEKAIFDAIERKNPQIAEKLRQTDKAYAKYKEFQKILDKQLPSKRIMGVPVNDVMTHLVFGTIGLATGTLPKIALGLGAKEAVQRLATRMLTDPRFQDIRKRMMQSITSGTQANRDGIFSAFLKILKKEDPDSYEELVSSDKVAE